MFKSLYPDGDYKRMNIKELVEERERTHGNFRDGACIHQSLMAAVYEGAAGPNKYVPPVALFALTMIMAKVSRILAGDPTFQDHWDDIAGYANRASETLGPSVHVNPLSRS